ncbi:hypothetical protein [Pelagicoccus sp. SDUM812005]|uniref:hypothetical protein n=1 Tax=Pelagicoccus sp. SDUM812005 TaxID=3041257 RepID=UPI00280E13F9|nr:hypothetical protein [Pelagicoccus sp. SDUM812005]MDQ8183159.1 hypothetical protein [Pelagicoccus sp. SDUM812005]
MLAKASVGLFTLAVLLLLAALWIAKEQAGPGAEPVAADGVGAGTLEHAEAAPVSAGEGEAEWIAYSPTQERAVSDWEGFRDAILSLPDDQQRSLALESVFFEWARENPEQALRRLEAFVDFESGDRVYNAILLKWSRRDLQAATSYAMLSPWSDPGIAGVMLARMYQENADAALTFLADPASAQEVGELAGSLLREVVRDDPVGALDLAFTLAPGRVDEGLLVQALAAALSENPDVGVEELERYLSDVGYEEAKRALLLVELDEDPTAALSKWESLEPELQLEMLPKLIERWSVSDVEAARSYVEAMPDRGMQKEAARAILVNWEMLDPGAAKAWARRMGL